MNTLFPPFLGQGSKGPVVNFAAMLLKTAAMENRDYPIELDGEYMPNGAIAKAVHKLQGRAGLPQTGDLDGETLKELSACVNVDLSKVTIDMFQGENVVVGAD